MNDDTIPQNVAEALRLALACAREIEHLLQDAHVPLNETSLLALTIVAATHAYRARQSVTDAFALYLAIFETAEQDEQEQLEEIAGDVAVAD